MVTPKLTSLLHRDQRTTSNGELRESPRRVTAQSKSAVMPRLTCQSLQWAWRVISSHAAEKSDTRQFKLSSQNKWCRPSMAQTSSFFNLRCILIWELLFNAVTWSLRRHAASTWRNVIHNARTAASAKKENAVAALTTTAITANTRVARAALSHSLFSFSLLHLLQLPSASCTPSTTCRRSKQHCQQKKPKEARESTRTAPS